MSEKKDPPKQPPPEPKRPKPDSLRSVVGGGGPQGKRKS
jgi:hypothetical protein